MGSAISMLYATSPFEALASGLSIAAVNTLNALAAKFGASRELRIKVGAPRKCRRR